MPQPSTSVATSDLVIGHGILYPLGIAAEKYDCRHVTLYLAGATFPSRYIPPIGTPNLGRFGNAFAMEAGDDRGGQAIAAFSQSSALSGRIDTAVAGKSANPSSNRRCSIW